MELFNNNEFFFCSLETVGLFDNHKKDANILLELSFLRNINSGLELFSAINKTDEKIDLEAMSIHNITTEKSKNGVIYNKSKPYKELYKFSNNNSNNNIIVVFDKDFTLNVLQNAGINIEGLKCIDLKQVVSHLYLSDKIQIISKPLKSLKLDFLRYYLPINDDIEEFLKTSMKKNFKFENSLKKSILIYHIFKFIVEKYKFSLDKLLGLSTEPVELKFVKFKGVLQKINELNEHDLIYLANSHFDVNVSLTCKELLMKKGIELDKHLITSGKYSGFYVENIEDIEYLEWFEQNMRHLDDKLLTVVKNRIISLKKLENIEKEFFVSIIEEENTTSVIGELPTNIRDWLKTQPFIDVKYNKCVFIFTQNNRKRQETILDKIKNSVKIIKIKKYK